MRGMLAALALCELPMCCKPCFHTLSPSSGSVPSLFDSPVERYLKAKQSVQHFTVTQLGKCCSDTDNNLLRSQW